MKILLVSTNRNTLPMPVMPIGACIIAHALERSGHAVHLLDLMFTRDATAAVESAVKGFQPDVVGVSVRNIDNNDMRNTVFYLDTLRNIVNALRTGTDAPIFLGGAAMGVMPEEILRLVDVSGGVIGDGETIFPLLVERITQGGSFRDLPGVAYIE
ncbi:MAG: cobalamin-dependent protein, partial [Candidatus Deferrimicrobium sp.]